VVLVVVELDHQPMELAMDLLLEEQRPLVVLLLVVVEEVVVLEELKMDRQVVPVS